MAVKKTEIRNKALGRLGVVGIGQVATNAQKVDLEAAYDEVYDELLEDDIVTWGKDENVPNRFVHPIVALVAYERVDEYGVGNERYQRIRQDAVDAKARIRRMAAEPYNYVPARFKDY